ncbi:MAG: PDZ domain-containing protein, partial [Bacteroidota bacterium]
MARIGFVCCLLLSITFLSAQHLSRKGMLGVVPQALTEDQAKAYGLKKPKGALINQVFPDHSAALMGLQAGDILVEVNQQVIRQPQDLYGVSQQLRSGDELTIQYVRDGQRLTATGTATPRPQETSAYATVVYDEVPFEGGHLRSIVHQPTSEGKHPAVYFIQGFPCQTMEAVNPQHPVKQLLE